MTENSQLNSENQSTKRKRGRPSLASKIANDPRYLAARGYNPLFASQVLEQVCNEREVWKRILSSEDDRVVLSAMQFLVAMRDGKPAQRINITSTQLTLNATELEKARAIVAEIRGTNSQFGHNGNSQSGTNASVIPELEQSHLSLAPRLGSPLTVDANGEVTSEPSNNVTRGLMLRNDGAAEKGGSR